MPLPLSKHHLHHLHFSSHPHPLFLPNMLSFFNDIIFLVITFPMLQKLFLALCSSISDFHYETYQLAKHCISLYFPSASSSINLFSLVHSDVWGTALITSTFGFCYFVTFVMVTLGSLGFTCWNLRVRFFQPFNYLTNWSKLSLTLSSKFFVEIMVENMCLLFFLLTLSA